MQNKYVQCTGESKYHIAQVSSSPLERFAKVCDLDPRSINQDCLTRVLRGLTPFDVVRIRRYRKVDFETVRDSLAGWQLSGVVESGHVWRALKSYEDTYSYTINNVSFELAHHRISYGEAGSSLFPIISTIHHVHYLHCTFSSFPGENIPRQNAYPEHSHPKALVKILFRSSSKPHLSFSQLSLPNTPWRHRRRGKSSTLLSAFLRQSIRTRRSRRN